MNDSFTSVASVAQKYSHRPGCRFLGAEEIGIAVFVMDLRVIVIESREVPPIEEFLLRSLRLSINTPRALSDFLGLDRRTVRSRLIEFRRSELIELEPGPVEAEDDVRCFLTARGRESADSLERAELREITIPGIVYHGFLRRPVIIWEELLLRPRELKAKGLREIRPLPSRHPTPDEIKLTELSEVVARVWKVKQKGRPPELVSVRSILKDVRTMYLPAVVLQYQPLGTKKQRQFAFAVDGVELEGYERAFAERNGADRHPELFAEAFRSTAELASDLLGPDVAKTLGPLGDADDLFDRLEAVDAKLETTQATLKDSDRPDTRQVLRAELEREKQTRLLLEEKLTHLKVYRLNTFHCRDLLKETLREVKERLVIVSAFLSASVVDATFLGSLETALKRGVKVWFAFGMGSDDGRDAPSPSWQRAERGLRELRKRYKSSFKLMDFGKTSHNKTHEKILIRDGDFVVSGSFNWLSYTGERGKGFRREDALRLTDPEMVEGYFRDITARFDAD
jgi:hypothetical protein